MFKRKKMKRILITASLLFGFTAFSQTVYMPTLPSTNITYPISILPDTITQSAQGPWDFSGVTTTGIDSITYQPIASSPFAGSYPNATHVKIEGGEQFFLGFATDKYTFHGERSVIITSYPIPLILMTYPFSVGDVHNHSRTQIPFTCNGCPPSMYRNDAVNTQAIASGTLTMPDNTVHNNATLVVNTRTFNDGQTGSSTCNLLLKQYQWWVSGYPFPVVQSIEFTAGQFCPPNIDFRKSKFLTGNPSVGIDESESSIASIYPNPTNDILNLNFKSPENIENKFIIKDATGRAVSQGILNPGVKNINVQNLAKGFYTLTLVNDEKTVLRFIKR